MQQKWLYIYMDIISETPTSYQDDTEKILNKPAEVAISNTSGLAGIAYWINKHYSLSGNASVKKQDEIVVKAKAAIDAEYADGRTTLMGDEEIQAIIKSIDPNFTKNV